MLWRELQDSRRVDSLPWCSHQEGGHQWSFPVLIHIAGANTGLQVPCETLWESFISAFPVPYCAPLCPTHPSSLGLNFISSRKPSLTLLDWIRLLYCMYVFNKPHCFSFRVPTMIIIDCIMILSSFVSLSKGYRTGCAWFVQHCMLGA